MYDSDLAHIHDLGFSDFARDAAPGILHVLRSAGIESGRVVELGCGSGVLARALLEAGFDVSGIDVSPAMVELARRRAPDAEFGVGSLHRPALPRCDAVVSIGECVCYTGRKGEPSLDRLFARVHHALRPGGLFIFDIREPAAGRSASTRMFREGDGWAVYAESTEDPGQHSLTRRITTFRRIEGTEYRRGQETHVLRLFRAVELAARLRRTGFRVRIRRAYGDLALGPARAALLGRRSDRASGRP